MGEILASELQKKNSADIFKFMDSRAPFDFGADALLSDGAYYPNAVQDHDGNWYDAVILGNQVWTVQNLRTTHFPDGEEIPVGSDASVMAPYCYNKTSSSIDIKKRGLLYNWAAIMYGESSSSAVPSGVQGVAPNGWHIPSKAEIDALIAYIKTQKRYVAGDDDDNIGKALAASEIWSASSVANAVGNDKTKNNYSGFNAIPSGIWDEGFDSEGSENFIATTTIDDNYVYGLSVRNNLAYPIVSQYRNYYGMSVRCLCNMSPVEFRTWYIKTYSGYPHIINTNETEEVFVCNFNGSSMDKTVQEIYAAADAGKVVVCNYQSRKYYLNLSSYSQNNYELSFVSVPVTISSNEVLIPFFYIIYKNQVWNYGNTFIDDVIYVTASNYDSETGEIELSLSVSQIQSNVNAGKAVLVVYSNSVYYLNWKGSSYLSFVNFFGLNFNTINYDSVSSKWYYSSVEIPSKSQVDKVFMCTFDGTSMNKTAQEIYEASQAGKVVVCTYENRKYYLEKSLLNSSAYELQFISMADVSTAFKPSVLFYHISYKNQTWSSGTILPEEVVYATTSNYNSVDGTIEVSMTPLQISTAVGGNKSVLLTYGDGVYVLTWTGSSPRFECLNMSTLRTIAYYESDSKWHLLTTQLATASQADKLLVCTYNATLYTMDKTYQEIVDAYNAGKVVICKHGNLTYYLSVVSESSSMIVFTQTTNVEGNTPSLAYIKYLNNAWSHGSKNVQQQLINNGANQNIKTVDGNTILGSGNVNIFSGVKYHEGNISSNSGSGFVGAITSYDQKIHYVVSDGVTYYQLCSYHKEAGYKCIISIDNRDNSNDIVINKNIIVILDGTTVNADKIYCPNWDTQDARTVKAGDVMELEVELYYGSSYVAFVKQTYGGSTMDEDIMYSQIPIDNDTY